MNKEQQKRRPGRPKQTDTNVDTKQFIMRTAAKMFMQQGYEQVSLALVARTCQLTKASLYYYFDTKAELFTQCVVNALAVAEQQTHRLLASEQSIDQKLRLAAIGRMNNVEIEFESMLANASINLTTEQIERIRTSEYAIYATITNALQQAMDAGELKQHNPLLLTHFFTNMLTLRNREHFMQLVDHDVEQAATEIVQLLMNGIANSH